MKLEWFQKWFGHDEASVDVPSSLTRWQALLLPISESDTVGSDVSSAEPFHEIKEQIAQLSGMDVDKVANDCQSLLLEHGKDLRPAVYLTYVLLRQEGYAGLAQGIELIALMLYHFGDATWPTRPAIRKSTLEWLCSPRVIDWLDTLEKPSVHDSQQVLRALDLLNEHCKTWSEAARPHVDALRKRFSVAGQDAVREVELNRNLSSALPNSAAGQFDISSTHALMESLRAMAAYLRQQPHGVFAAYRLVRGVRWDNVPTLPPHDAHNTTRLAGPRSALRQQIKRLLLQKQWHALLEKIEFAFLEGANHFWLDLQYYAWEAFSQVGEDYRAWREIALTDLTQMRARLAGVEQLRFNDGSHFADDMTLEWLASHAVIRDIEAGESMSRQPMLPGHAVEQDSLQNEAFALAESHGLEHAFDWMQALPQAKGGRELAFRQAVMARLAEAHNRGDLALHLLSGLNDKVSTPTVRQWDPLFVFEVKAHYVHLLRQRLSRKDVDKAQLMHTLQQLQADLVQLDPLRALMLPPI